MKQEVGNSIPILTVDLNAIDLSTDLEMLRFNQMGIGEIESIKFKGSEPIGFQNKAPD